MRQELIHQLSTVVAQMEGRWRNTVTLGKFNEDT